MRKGVESPAHFVMCCVEVNMLGILVFAFGLSSASYHEKYIVPHQFSDKWESYIFSSKEYIIQNLPVNWKNANILCGGHYNATLAIIDTKEKADFLAEALSESQFDIDSVWVGARRNFADDPAGYRWSHGVELKRTARDVLLSELDTYVEKFPVWLNRTHVPVPPGGADCVGLERIQHDRPVFLDLPCHLERPFVCQRDAKSESSVTELKTVRCRTGLYRVFDGRLEWRQAASYCLLRDMTLATVETEKCLKKLGKAMLKTRPSIEGAWIGARGDQGKWSWTESGATFQPPAHWPPMSNRFTLKDSGCLHLDRHDRRPPVFLQARCDRKLQFICYQGLPALRTPPAPPSDDLYTYMLVREPLYWQHAYDNCQKMNGSLASLESGEVLIQLLMLMGENKDEPISHIWISGRLNTSREQGADDVSHSWYNPSSGKAIPETKEAANGLYLPPWLEEDSSIDSSCLNLDRQDHLDALVYGLPCDTAQYSVCMIDKALRSTELVTVETTTSEGYESL